MGWLWSSSSSHPQDQLPSSNSFSPDHPSDPPPPPPPPQDQPSSSFPQDSSTQTPPPSKQTRDQLANDELLTFLHTLQSSRQRPHSPSSSPSDDNDDDDDNNNNPPELLTPAHLYDTHPSCTTLFETAFACNSPGGQFLNVYRYGTLRQCGSLWREVMWCVRTNRSWMSEEERRQKTVRKMWERERERLRERGGCAEEVWGPGRRWVERGAFGGDWEGGVWRRDGGGGL